MKIICNMKNNSMKYMYDSFFNFSVNFAHYLFLIVHFSDKY